MVIIPPVQPGIDRDVSDERGYSRWQYLVGRDRMVREMAVGSAVTVCIGILAIERVGSIVESLSILPAVIDFAPFIFLGVGIAGLFLAIERIGHPVIRGGVLGASAFLVFASTISLLLSAALLTDGGVLGLSLLVLVGAAAAHSYANRGLLVCWILVGAPVAAFAVQLIVVYGGLIPHERTMFETIGRIAGWTVLITGFAGTIGFLVGWIGDEL